MDNGYLCHLIFALSKFILKNFIFLEIISNIMVSQNIFLCNEGKQQQLLRQI